jgi:hypothetical protein
MKKTYLILIVFFAIVLGVVITSILVDRYREKRVNTYDFPDSIVVNNYTDNFRADTVAMIISHMILEYDTINIDIFDAPELKNDELEIAAFIQKTDKPHGYQVFLKKTSKQYTMRFLSHELIHLDQMERGDLITFIGNFEYCIYMGDTIDYYVIPYKERPHEIDAFNREYQIEKRLKKLLYKKES